MNKNKLPEEESMQYGILRPSRRTGSIKGVLFDMDGVVLDTEKLYCRFWREAAMALGYPMTVEQALGMRSLNAQAGQEKLESYFGPGVSREAMKQKRVELMDAYVSVHGVDPKPGIHELLDALNRRGIRTAITTSSPMDRVRRYLKPLGLLDRFDCLCSGHDVPRGKPEPDIYLHGAACVGLAPEECLAIEDSYAGVLSASRAGCLTVLIPDLDEPAQETLEPLYACCEKLTDILDLLD
jgi:HAD superfamily hydrolase (TIGR01509 family)